MIEKLKGRIHRHQNAFTIQEIIYSFRISFIIYLKWNSISKVTYIYFLCSFFEYTQYIKCIILPYNSSIYLMINEKSYHYISKISSYWKIHVHVPNSFLTLLKLGAPSVCGASFTSLSMPSKWSVIALHVEMSAMMMFYFLFKHNI